MQSNILAMDENGLHGSFPFNHSPTYIPDPSNIAYRPTNISHFTPAQRAEHNEYKARSDDLNTFGLENMEGNFPITVNHSAMYVYSNFKGC